MEIEKDLAIVLKSVPYEERHKIITAITQNHGMITAIAKNSVQSRRFGGSLDLFTASDWILRIKPNSDWVQLTEAQVRHSFDGLRKDFAKLALASAFNEFILRLAPHHPVFPELFPLHSNALFALDQAEELQDTRNHVILLNAYLAKLLHWNGNQPQLDTCLQCQSPLTDFEPQAELTCVRVSPGWICPRCKNDRAHERDEEQTPLKVSRIAIEDFKQFVNTPIRQTIRNAQASSKQHHALFRWIEALFIYHMPGFDRSPIKSLRFLGLQ